MRFDNVATLLFGHIVLVPFPFTNQSASKRRPAVVVSNAAYNEARPDLIIMAITSQLGRESSDGIGFGEMWIEDWQSADLLKPAVVEPVIATIEANLNIRKLGELSVRDANALQSSIYAIICKSEALA